MHPLISPVFLLLYSLPASIIKWFLIKWFITSVVNPNVIIPVTINPSAAKATNNNPDIKKTRIIKTICNKLIILYLL